MSAVVDRKLTPYRAPRARHFVIAAGLGLLAIAPACRPATEVADDGRALRDLLSLLDEQTDLATKTRLNADYVPGMATVLSGDELLARGARNVWEALALVPGISQGMEFTGERQILSRGVGHGYGSGNVKILLDNVSMNSTLLATANPVLNMPIEQVERIEVIRGPGSSVHGEYAYAGVVNVITRRAQHTLHGQAGSGSSFGGGGIWQWRDDARDLAFSVNAAGLDSDGADVRVEQDALYHTGDQALSNAPGPSNEAQTYRGLHLNLKWGDYFATLKVLDDGYGDHFGINHFLPPPEPHIASWQRYRVLGLGRDLALSDTLNARLRLEAMEHRRERDGLYVYPAGFWGRSSVRMDLDYQESRLLGAADIHWRPRADHDLLLGLELKRIEIDEAGWSWFGLPFEIPPGWIDTSRERRVASVLVQDQYRPVDPITLTGTLRYDDYSDVGHHFSPRLAAVWRIDHENILKLQYARAFRPPTFYEQEYAGRGSIEQSEVTTYELGYIFKMPHGEARFIVFRSNLRGPIVFDELNTGGYINDDDVRLSGIELEYQQGLGRHLKLDANLSYVDTAYRSSGRSLPGGAEWLANVGLLWRPAVDWSLTLQTRYVGERNRSARDTRDRLGDYLQADLTLGWMPGTGGLSAWLGVKNIADADIRFPDQLTTDYEGEYYLSYPGDYPRPGRQWWLSVAYDFGD